MTINIAALPEAPVASPSARVVQTTPVSAAGVNDSAALARQQLPSAVPAPALIAAYSAAVTPESKPPRKFKTNGASSQLAAQMIAQLPDISVQELAIFIPRSVATSVETSAGEQAFISPQQVARAETAMPKEGAPALANAALQPSVSPVTTAIAEAAIPSQSLALSAMAPLLVMPLLRPPTLAKARGVAAYQLTIARNNAPVRTAA